MRNDGNGLRTDIGGTTPIGVSVTKEDLWITTPHGHKFYFTRPEEHEYLLSDIGHALGNLCRFVGHGGWWSVAQHSLFVAELLEPKDKLRGLLHDAAEAYMADVPGPLKLLPIMDGYNELEDRVIAAIHKQFGIPEDAEAEVRVKHADLTALKAEAKMLELYTDEWIVSDFPEVEIPRWILGARYSAGVEFEKRAIWYLEQ